MAIAPLFIRTGLPPTECVGASVAVSEVRNSMSPAGSPTNAASCRSTFAGSRAISSYCTTSTGPRRRMASTTRLRTSQLAVENDALNLSMYSTLSRSGSTRERFHEYTTARGSRMSCATRTSTPGTRPSATGSIGRRDESTTTCAPVTDAIAWYTADEASV